MGSEPFGLTLGYTLHPHGSHFTSPATVSHRPGCMLADFSTRKQFHIFHITSTAKKYWLIWYIQHMPNKRTTRRRTISSGTRLKDHFENPKEAQGPDGEWLTGWEYFLARIAAGSTMQQEAERLQSTPASLNSYIYTKKFPERKQAYREAREIAAEVQEESYKDKARELLEEGFINRDGEFERWTRDQVAARDKGLYHVFQRQKYANRERFGDQQQINHRHDVSGALLERLEQVAAEKKKAAQIEHDPGRVIDADFTEVSREIEPETHKQTRESDN